MLGNNVAPKATFLGVWSSRFVAFRLWRRRNDGYRDDVSKGGFFNSKQEYRSLNDGTAFGLYATDTIQKGETLFDVPWECILFSKQEHASSNAMQCETTFSLIREMNKGRESVYAPYVDPYVEYLQSLPTNMIPSAWSEEGKDLLELVCGYEQLPPDEPVLWLSKDWKMNCRGSTENETAALLVLSKGDDGLMVPLLEWSCQREGIQCRFENPTRNQVSNGGNPKYSER